MSFRQTVNKYFSDHAETHDNHADPALQTRYYKTKKDNAMAELQAIFNNKQLYKMNAVSQEHGEISAYTKKGRKVFIIGTIIMVKPFQTAVDFSVTTESAFPFDFGYSNKMINRLYQQMDEQLPKLEQKG